MASHVAIHKELVIFALLIFVTFASQAKKVQPPPLPCQADYLRHSFQFHANFSNKTLPVTERRLAERHIKAGREVLSETDDYCTALYALRSEPDTSYISIRYQHRAEGEIHAFKTDDDKREIVILIDSSDGDS